MMKTSTLGTVFLVVLALFSFGCAGTPWPGRNPPRQASTLTVADPSWEQRVYVGDSLLLTVGTTSLVLRVKAVGPDVVLDFRGDELPLLFGEEVFLDLDRDSLNDIRVILVDLNLHEPDNGAVLAIDRLLSPQESVELEATAPSPELSGDPLDPVLSGSFVFLEEDTPRPFSLILGLRGGAYLAYRVDDHPRQESAFRNGEMEALEASRKITVWSSDAGALLCLVEGRTVVLGRPGEVAAGEIQWQEDKASGRYLLRLTPLD